MLIPIRCFTCGKVLADKYDYYVEQVQELKKKVGDKEQKKKVDEMEHQMRHFEPLRTGPILDKLQIKRFCCRRMFLGTEDMMDTI